jgi:hypothetical protein
VFLDVAFMVVEGNQAQFRDMIELLTTGWGGAYDDAPVSWKSLMAAAAVRMYESDQHGNYKFVPNTPYDVIRQGRHLR